MPDGANVGVSVQKRASTSRAAETGKSYKKGKSSKVCSRWLKKKNENTHFHRLSVGLGWTRKDKGWEGADGVSAGFEV